MPRKTKETDNKKLNLKDLLLPKKNTKTTDAEKVANPKAKNKTPALPKKAVKEKKSTVKEIKQEAKTLENEKKPKKASQAKNVKSKSATKQKVDEIMTETTNVMELTEEITTEKSTIPKVSTKKSTSSTKTTKKASPKSVSSKSKVATKREPTSYSPEYYDLPYKYNQTVVKILAQTPTTLFIYWEISDEDRENLKQQYGEYFFEITKPVLIVHNETLNYFFEIDINDFANSWYLHVNDSNCEYKIELGRRPIPINYDYMPQYDLEKNGPIHPIETSYIYISSSNKLETPNDHILFHKQNKVYFRNLKTNQITEKDIKEFPFIAKDHKFVSIYELYEDLYKEEILNNHLDLHNPSSSGNPGSGNLSSKFR